MDDTSASNTPAGPEPGERAPAHLSVPATRPIETMSREATARRAEPSDKVKHAAALIMHCWAKLAVAYTQGSEGGRNAELSGPTSEATPRSGGA
jgi:hypothetical protein